MNNNRKELQIDTKRTQYIGYAVNGIRRIFTSISAAAIAAIYGIILYMMQLYIIPAITPTGGGLFVNAQALILKTAFPFVSIFGFLILLTLLGAPWGANRIQSNLIRAGITNGAGEAPTLAAKSRDKSNTAIDVLRFKSNGIPLCKWQDAQAEIEAALNINIVRIEQGKSNAEILMHCVDGSKALQTRIDWHDKYLSKEDFELALGENQLGKITVNLNKIPHMLIGGSTGSGKSILLKCVLMQCVKKGAIVHVADLKGGVDFAKSWEENCNLLLDDDSIIAQLHSLVEELEYRKKLLKSTGYANVADYNRTVQTPLPRIIFACDEVAELLDKTGRSKSEKERISEIEGLLSTLARQGRAFAINLILATQRPDANILCGQIKNNIDFRVCGRADDVLSQIILDNTDAADKIPKNSQGRFLTNSGEVFQGYWLDEQTCFAKHSKGGVPID